jgi:hypothetical protein
MPAEQQNLTPAEILALILQGVSVVIAGVGAVAGAVDNGDGTITVENANGDEFQVEGAVGADVGGDSGAFGLSSKELLLAGLGIAAVMALR